MKLDRCMKHVRNQIWLIALISISSFCISLSTTHAAGPLLRALIVTGQHHHSWKEASEDFKLMLEKTGRFKVDMSVTPTSDADPQEWESWHPNFSQYDVVLLKYLGDEWPSEVKKSFVNYIHGGGGLFTSHASIPEYLDMVGLGWQGSGVGTRLIYDETSAEYERLPRFHGAGAAHGKQHEFAVTIRQTDHPITKGMPKVWMQSVDELYHGLRGPANNMNILATAFSDLKQWGTGVHEPIAWTVNYGKGRVVVTPLGHRFSEDFKYDPAIDELDHGANGVKALHSVGFQTLVVRGSEWAASGEVTIPIPKNFPTEKTSSSIHPEKVVWE